MKTKEAKAAIFHEVAKTGTVTSAAMRIYIEHRISKKTFDEIVNKAMQKYNDHENAN